MNTAEPTCNAPQIDADIVSVSEGLIKRRSNLLRIGLSIIIIKTSLVFFAVALNPEEKSLMLELVLIVFGILTFMTAGFLLIFGKRGLTYVPTASRITKRKLYFDQACLYSLHQSLLADDFECMAGVREEHHKGAMAELYESADGNFFAIQLYRYVPHAYSPITPIYIRQ